jgi:hypothetical protein
VFSLPTVVTVFVVSVLFLVLIVIAFLKPYPASFVLHHIIPLHPADRHQRESMKGNIRGVRKGI